MKIISKIFQNIEGFFKKIKDLVGDGRPHNPLPWSADWGLKNIFVYGRVGYSQIKKKIINASNQQYDLWGVL